MEPENTKTSIFLRQWNAGDQQALNAILERHLPWIRAQVRKRLTRLLRRKGESGDYVQDAVIQFLSYGPRFILSNEAHFRAILMRIVENALHDKYDWFTTQRREIALERPLPSDTVLFLDPPHGRKGTPSKSAERHEQEAWIRLGMELLEADDREILVLRQWNKQSFPKIGEHLGLSPDAARMKYKRAVGKLGDQVGALRHGKLTDI